MNDLEVWHEEERRCIKRINEIDPRHPVLEIMFHSTYAACEAYWKTLRELHSLGETKNVRKRERKENYFGKTIP